MYLQINLHNLHNLLYFIPFSLVPQMGYKSMYNQYTFYQLIHHRLKNRFFLFQLDTQYHQFHYHIIVNMFRVQLLKPFLSTTLLLTMMTNMMLVISSTRLILELIQTKSMGSCCGFNRFINIGRRRRNLYLTLLVQDNKSDNNRNHNCDAIAVIHNILQTVRPDKGSCALSSLT